MKNEGYHPTNEEFKKVRDLPREERHKYVDVEERGVKIEPGGEETKIPPGFVRKEAAEFLATPYRRSLEETAASYDEERENVLNKLARQRSLSPREVEEFKDDIGFFKEGLPIYPPLIHYAGTVVREDPSVMIPFVEQNPRYISYCSLDFYKFKEFYINFYKNNPKEFLDMRALNNLPQGWSEIEQSISNPQIIKGWLINRPETVNLSSALHVLHWDPDKMRELFELICIEKGYKFLLKLEDDFLKSQHLASSEAMKILARTLNDIKNRRHDLEVTARGQIVEEKVKNQSHNIYLLLLPEIKNLEQVLAFNMGDTEQDVMSFILSLDSSDLDTLFDSTNVNPGKKKILIDMISNLNQQKLPVLAKPEAQTSRFGAWIKKRLQRQ